VLVSFFYFNILNVEGGGLLAKNFYETKKDRSRDFVEIFDAQLSGF